jgi:hypothetical protein
MTNTENYSIDFLEFGGLKEITKQRLEKEANFRSSLLKRRMKTERPKEQRYSAIHRAQKRIDRAWIKMDRTTQRASLRKVHQGRTSY